MEMNIDVETVRSQKGKTIKKDLLNAENRKDLIEIVRQLGLENWNILAQEFKAAIIANDGQKLDRYAVYNPSKPLDYNKPEVIEAELLAYLQEDYRWQTKFSIDDAKERLLQKELGVFQANRAVKHELSKQKIAYLELALAKTLAQITGNESK